MKQEEKRQLLLKDLYMRLPYGFTVHRYSDGRDITFGKNELDEFSHFLEYSEGKEFKPYLRPMSSMTDEERQEAREKFFNGSDHYDIDDIGEIYADTYQPYTTVYTLSFARLSGYIDWLNEHHLDFRGLIEMDLAIEEPDDMYRK